MAYYGAFGSLPYIFAKKIGNEGLFILAVSISIIVGICIKKAFHITFIGPDRHGRNDKAHAK